LLAAKFYDAPVQMAAMSCAVDYSPADTLVSLSQRHLQMFNLFCNLPLCEAIEIENEKF